MLDPYPNTVAVTFNTTQPPFTNKKIRQAFSYAIERQPLVDGIVLPGVPAAYAWVPPSMKLSSNDYFKEDAAKAKGLLAEGLKERKINPESPRLSKSGSCGMAGVFLRRSRVFPFFQRNTIAIDS